MSDIYDEWHPFERAQEIPCARCEALPGQPCRTINGRKATQPHASRWEPLATAYGTGYADGFDNGLKRGMK